MATKIKHQLKIILMKLVIIKKITNDSKTQGEWEIHLTMTINFFSSKDSEETCTMYSKSDNIKIMVGNETDKIIEDLFDSFLQRYESNLEESMRGSEFVFDCVDSLYYKLHKISPNRRRTYIDSPKRLKYTKAAINSKNDDDVSQMYNSCIKSRSI